MKVSVICLKKGAYLDYWEYGLLPVFVELAFFLFFPYCTDKPLLNMKPISGQWAGIESYLSQRISKIISDWGLELYSRQLLLVPVVCYPFKLHAQKLELLGAELQSACTHTATRFFNISLCVLYFPIWSNQPSALDLARRLSKDTY